jgi:hypothetical protein
VSAKLLGWAVRLEGLTMAEKMILVVLADRSKDDIGMSFYAQSTIAKVACCSRRTAITALAGLEEKGHILRKPWATESGARTADRIFLLAPWCAKFAQGGVQDLRTIPSTPYGVRKKGKGARQGVALGLRLVHSSEA